MSHYPASNAVYCNARQCAKDVTGREKIFTVVRGSMVCITSVVSWLSGKKKGKGGRTALCRLGIVVFKYRFAFSGGDTFELSGPAFYPLYLSTLFRELLT